MSEPRTVGEAVEKYGYCELMLLVAELAEKRGRIPVGLWQVDGLPDGWVVTVNGQREWHGRIPPFSVLVEHHGTPLGIFDAAGGTVLADSEAAIAAMLRGALSAAGGPQA